MNLNVMRRGAAADDDLSSDVDQIGRRLAGLPLYHTPHFPYFSVCMMVTMIAYGRVKKKLTLIFLLRAKISASAVPGN